MDVGSEFQRVGAVIAKARSPKVRRLVRTIGVRRFVPAERRWRVLKRGEGIRSSWQLENFMVERSLEVSERDRGEKEEKLWCVSGKLTRSEAIGSEGSKEVEMAWDMEEAGVNYGRTTKMEYCFRH
ncbi:unnamed protein product [Leuciscus chuanchicus]